MGDIATMPAAVYLLGSSRVKERARQATPGRWPSSRLQEWASGDGTGQLALPVEGASRGVERVDGVGCELRLYRVVIETSEQYPVADHIAHQRGGEAPANGPRCGVQRVGDIRRTPREVDRVVEQDGG